MEKKRQEAPGRLEQVREFVNTADLEAGRDDLVSAATLTGWLIDRGFASRGVRASRADLARALELREAIRALLLANGAGTPSSSEARRVIDRTATRAGLRPCLRADGTSVLEPDAAGIDGALGRVVAVIHAAAAEGSWKRLKACRDDDCRWAFYDHTKNHSGAWCTMGVCGNRAKARTYRARRRHVA
jgi:predicted RNA-binding Zn ribbon-like protein